MGLSINPFNTNNPMTLKDAAIVATITAFATWILCFLAESSYGVIRADPLEFVFNAVKTYAVTWAGSFITLAGLEQYVKGKEEKPSE